MLRELRVRDLAVIADVSIRLEPGLNALTGETGAGKSILIDALSLLLGERASADRLRPGAERAVVEAAFDVAPGDGLRQAVDDAGLEIVDDQFVVRREIAREGRNRVWVNGSPTTVGVLSALGRRLVDIHGQHESQSLLRPAVQRDLLDAFAGADGEREAVRATFDTVAAVRAEEEELRARLDDIQKRSDYLQHVVQEITEVDPRSGEDEALQTESQRLTHAEDLTRLADAVSELLGGDEGSVTGLLGEVDRTLNQLERIDPSTVRWREALDTLVALTDDLGRESADYASEVEIDPIRLRDVEERRDRLFRLTKKYGETIDAVLETQRSAREELELLDSARFDLGSLGDRRDEAERAFRVALDALHQKRREAVAGLSEAVAGVMRRLGLPDSEFHPLLEPLKTPGPNGGEIVTFLVRLNKGLDPRPLAQVASGGELSRIMLALKVVLARHDPVATLIFDEVDQGIGGEVGAQVGEALADVARSHQVLVVTHLPQIAARAGCHLHVAKGELAGVAATTVRSLSVEERVEELARMLGGVEDAALRQHADALLGRTAGAAVPRRARRIS